MNNWTLAFALAFSFMGGPLAAQDAMIITNAKVYTVNADRSWAEAIYVDGNGVIQGVGTSSDLLKAHPTASVVDLGGQLVLPGFQDVHMHAIEAGISDSYCEMPQFGSVDDFVDALDFCVADWDGGEWIMGAGVNMTSLLGTVSDPLALIDEMIPDRPALIIDDIGHGAWANSLALEAAGLDLLTQDPPGGILVRLADGRLSGVVLESLSQTLIDASQPARNEHLDFAYNSLIEAMDVLASNGITTISDAGGYWPRGHDRIWAEADANGDLSVRANNALYVYPDLPIDLQIAELIRRRTNDPQSLVRFNQVKIYVDGILTQATGALLAPYSASLGLLEEDEMGFEYFERDTLLRYVRELSAAGFQLHIHTTGDRGARLALDAIAAADVQSGPHRITHLYMVDGADIPRFAALNVVADFQMAPSSLTSDYSSFLSGFIGVRSKSILPFDALYESGALLTLSSDWDADELSPLVKLQTVLTRPNKGSVDLAAAIEMMTINPAQLLKHADKTGSIEVGKFADLVVIDRDIFSVPPSDISSAQVTATLLQGEAVFDPAGVFAID